jgi:hypothetical protein
MVQIRSATSDCLSDIEISEPDEISLYDPAKTDQERLFNQV